jgi:hypothetical protein
LGGAGRLAGAEDLATQLVPAAADGYYECRIAVFDVAQKAFQVVVVDVTGGDDRERERAKGEGQCVGEIDRGAGTRSGPSASATATRSTRPSSAAA